MREVREKPNGNVIAKFVEVMSTKCLLCQKEINENDGCFYALDVPYNGVLHSNCAPYYNFPQRWPHEQPVLYYEKKENIK